jgi:hypothetical protein
MGFVFLPGGFGTLDEFFEVLTLVQTHRIPRFPVILFSEDFWRGLLRWMKSTLEPQGLINRGDLELAQVVDSTPEALEIILDYQRRVGPPDTVPAAFA